jgi:hypothetical protein
MAGTDNVSFSSPRAFLPRKTRAGRAEKSINGKIQILTFEFRVNDSQ